MHGAKRKKETEARTQAKKPKVPKVESTPGFEHPWWCEHLVSLAERERMGSASFSQSRRVPPSPRVASAIPSVPGMRRPFSPLQRWHLVVAEATRERSSRWRWIVAAGAVLLFLLAAGSGGFLPLAGRIALGIAGLAASVHAARRTSARPSGVWLEADPGGIARVASGTSSSVARWDAPFGITLLASYGRPTALLAFTDPTKTRYVPVRIDGRTEDEDDQLAGLAVLADLDLVDGLAHGPALTSVAAAEVLRTVAERQRDALGRVMLSAPDGAPIVLDRSTLTVGDRSFDLSSTLEWRTLMFHESVGQGLALYQATWVRQGSAEVVFVAPMPASIVPREPVQREATGKLGRSLTRDLRLLQAPAEAPPARDVRIAIDRPFMMAVRRALDEAPLAVRIAVESAPKVRSERRRSLT